jgi:hypothetical protein
MIKTKNIKFFNLIFFLVFLFVIMSCNNKNESGSPDSNDPNSPTTPTSSTVNTTKPSAVVKLTFIHHSTGSDWIASGTGNLGTNLNLNNYYVTESDYGWTAAAMAASCGGTDIGNRTDTIHWPCWFTSETMPSVYDNTSHYDYPANTISDPGGENQIIMFKSCFPNSEVGASIDDEKAIYNGLLSYFAAHQNKMFVLIIPPPEIVITSATLTRQLANWLADRENGWLSGYTNKNVYAFDYYNVLTHPDNHHRVNNGVEEHLVANSQNSLYYYSGADDHPTAAGHQKATLEFLPLLNSWYNKWIR